jgi:hypothetical protein
MNQASSTFRYGKSSCGQNLTLAVLVKLGLVDYSEFTKKSQRGRKPNVIGGFGHGHGDQGLSESESNQSEENENGDVENFEDYILE